MMLSRYTKVIPHYPTKSTYSIYSMLHDSLCVVSEPILKGLKIARTKEKLREAFSADEYNTLHKLRMLRDTNEKEVCENMVKDMMNVTENLNLIIYLTAKCNLGCSYCFQPRVLSHRPSTMGMATATALIRWIGSFCKVNEVKKMSVLFYGGEPLLNRDVLEYLAERVSAISRRMRLKHDLLVTTNGTLLDRDFVRKMMSLGLSDIQITIDGTKETHDARRPFKNGEPGCYDAIMHNLALVAKDTSKIILRINFDRENAENVPRLLRVLKKNKLAHKVKIHLMPVNKPFRNWGKSSVNLIASNRELAGYFLKYYSLAEKLGMTIVPYYSAGVCQFFGKFSFSITPDGDIYKCPNLLDKYFCVGSIYEGVSEERNNRVRNVPLEECMDCKFVVVCAKGCRHQAYVRHGNVSQKFCQKDILEELMTFYIRHEVKEKLYGNGRRGDRPGFSGA
jgi:uncharacterized protein